MDDLDKNILRMLVEDGRAPYRHVAASQGISIGTVHNRISKMMDGGIITKFTTRVDLERCGYKMTTVTTIKVESSSNIDLVRNYLKQFKDSTVLLYHVSGGVDFLMINKFKDFIDLGSFNDALSSIPGTRVEMNVVIDVIEDAGTGGFVV